MVILGDSRSKWARVGLGAPQGQRSVFGPVLYIHYTCDISPLIAKHDATYHLYADDTQAFVHGSPINQLALASSTDALTRDFHSWMASNRLCLSSMKGQVWKEVRKQSMI